MPNESLVVIGYNDYIKMVAAILPSKPELHLIKVEPGYKPKMVGSGYSSTKTGSDNTILDAWPAWMI